MKDDKTQNDKSTYDLTSAAVMEAEERELVIDDSVDDLMTYSDKELTDAQIEKKRLHLKDIVPKPNQA
ncbi:hypothetical protein [Pelistega suis]|uniref:hypothetical protein n=1 Tax=Pelistega suis TaxID=1631957 RepID=UPI00211D05E0|nr:hypothetical protein [Pelistega suis]MCQ9328450.1 hypothetical protein [Pelistega suis]